MSKKQDNIVFFDGVCGVCNAGVDFLIKIDSKNQLFFAPLQGKTASKQIDPTYIKQLDTLILYKDSKVYLKSAAVFQIIKIIGKWYKIFLFFQVFPLKWTDGCYDFIAKNRYQWFGKKETCRIPTLQERNRFLD